MRNSYKIQETARPDTMVGAGVSALVLPIVVSVSAGWDIVIGSVLMHAGVVMVVTAILAVPCYPK